LRKRKWRNDEHQQHHRHEPTALLKRCRCHIHSEGSPDQMLWQLLARFESTGQ
jgi:hypothetical protein